MICFDSFLRVTCGWCSHLLQDTAADTRSNRDESGEASKEEKDAGTLAVKVLPTTLGLSNYEKERLENIARNNAVLERLGLIGPTMVKQDIPVMHRQARGAHKHKMLERRIQPPRASCSTATYKEEEEDGENKSVLKRKSPPAQSDHSSNHSSTKKARVSSGTVCTLTYDSIPSWLRDKYPLNEGRNSSGHPYVHQVKSGWQTQVHVAIANGRKCLVHHGIFQDLRTAALAQAVASANPQIARNSLGGRAFLESMTEKASGEPDRSTPPDELPARSIGLGPDSHIQSQADLR